MKIINANEILNINGGGYVDRCWCGAGNVPNVGKYMGAEKGIASKAMASGRQCENHCCNEVLADWFFWGNEYSKANYNWGDSGFVNGAC